MNNTFTVSMQQQENYRFEVDFGDGIAHLIADEPQPLGDGMGPGPAHLLAAAAANCLTASLLFALSKFKQDARGIRAFATGYIGRNAQNRLRVEKIDVTIDLSAPAQELAHLDRILSQFEAFCTVSQSLQQGIDIAVTVRDGERKILKSPSV